MFIKEEYLKALGGMYARLRLVAQVDSEELTLVNKYQWSSIARQKCIQYYGCKCFVCGFEFEKVYGEHGKNFIRVHHLIPIN